MVNRQALIEDNIGFVVRIAQGYRNKGLDFDDLLSEGKLGLVKAAGRYDPARGTKFITYAVWWIRKSILEALGDQSRMIRIPANRYKQLRQDKNWTEPVVLGDSHGDPGLPSILDRLVDEREGAESEFLGREACDQLRQELGAMSASERLILTHRFGLDDAACLTLRELGVLLGVSHERVRQLEVQARTKLRRRMRLRWFPIATASNGPANRAVV